MVSNKTLQWRAVHLRSNLQWCHILITHPANSMSTQIFYYMPIHYTSILFWSPHYYRPGLIILT